MEKKVEVDLEVDLGLSAGRKGQAVYSTTKYQWPTKFLARNDAFVSNSTLMQLML